MEKTAKNKTSPAAVAKAAGLKSISQMSVISNVKQRTLYDMFKKNRQQFNITAMGCANDLMICRFISIKKGENNDS